MFTRIVTIWCFSTGGRFVYLFILNLFIFDTVTIVIQLFLAGTWVSQIRPSREMISYKGRCNSGLWDKDGMRVHVKEIEQMLEKKKQIIRQLKT